jgi:NAD(P)H dehydrogenase (quinone)
MKYVISGASASLGRLTADKLLQQLDANDLTMVTRNPDSLAEYSARGVNVVKGHHGDPESLREPFSDADALFMISSLAIGHRTKHHKDTIAVAEEAGVKHITYTSVAGAHPQNPTPSAMEHTATESVLHKSDISFTALRNQVYSELLYKIIVDQVIHKKRFIQNCLHGGMAPVSRLDIAAAVVAIMTNPEKHHRVVYEVTGPERFTYPEFIALAGKIWNMDFEYIAISDEEMANLYAKVGVSLEPDPSSSFIPKTFGAKELTAQARAYEMGFLDIVSAHVEIITGEKPRTLESVMRELKAHS